MLEINITNLNDELFQLEELISDYENQFINLCNEYKNASFSWHDSYSVSLFKNMEVVQNKVKIEIQTMEEVKEIYHFLIQKYSSIAKEIYFKKDEIDIVLNHFNTLLSEMDNTLNIYERLNLEYFDYERNLLESEKQNLLELKESLVVYRDEFKQMVKKIDQLEFDIKHKLSKVSIEIKKDYNG